MPSIIEAGGAAPATMALTPAGDALLSSCGRRIDQQACTIGALRSSG